jgi:hypothetical protein
MDADAGIGRPGSARDKGNAGPLHQRAVCARHEGHSALLTAYDCLDLRHVMERIKHREETFPRHGENAVTAVYEELIDENAAAGPQIGLLRCHGQCLASGD